MVSDITRIVYARLSASFAANGEPAVRNATIWNEDRPREGSSNYVTYSVDMGASVGGTAPVSEITVVVNCYSRQATSITLLADAVTASLDSYDGMSGSMRVAGLTSTGWTRGYESDSDYWVIEVRFSGLAIG